MATAGRTEQASSGNHEAGGGGGGIPIGLGGDQFRDRGLNDHGIGSGLVDHGEAAAGSVICRVGQRAAEMCGELAGVTFKLALCDRAL
jgi:hypothetical protein